MNASGFTPPVRMDDAMAVLDTAVRSTDADEFDICLLGRAGQYTRFAAGRIHQPQDITEVQLMVRAVVDGHAARAATSNLAGVPAATALAAKMARGLAAAAGTPGSTRVATDNDQASPAEDLLWKADTESFDESARVAVVRRATAAAVDQGGTAAGMIGRAVTQLAVASSGGVRRSCVATEALGGFTFAVADGTAHFMDLGRSVLRFGLDDAAARTAAQAAAMQRRRALEPGSYTVVLGPEATAEMLEFLPEFGFSGELAAHGTGLCVSSHGERLATRLITVADDALGDVGLPIGFDMEGSSKRSVPFLTAGVVGGPVTDLHTAGLLGQRSTGHAHIAREQVPEPKAANIVMKAGDSSEEQLIAGVDRGVYIQRFWYTRVVDPAAGTITGVTRDACFEIRDGKLAAPLAGMRFTQSILALLGTVDGVGDTVRSIPMMNVWNGATTAPAIRAHGFRLGSAPAGREGTAR